MHHRHNSAADFFQGGDFPNSSLRRILYFRTCKRQAVPFQDRKGSMEVRQKRTRLKRHCRHGWHGQVLDLMSIIQFNVGLQRCLHPAAVLTAPLLQHALFFASFVTPAPNGLCRASESCSDSADQVLRIFLCSTGGCCRCWKADVERI